MNPFRDFSDKIYRKYGYFLTIKRAEGLKLLLSASYFAGAFFLLRSVFTDREPVSLDDGISTYGMPVIRDHSEEHRKMRESGIEHGIIRSFNLTDGYKSEEYHRGQYLQTLEIEALERARREQLEARERGIRLPENIIKLV